MKPFIDSISKKGYERIPLSHQGVNAMFTVVKKEPQVVCFVDCDVMAEDDASTLANISEDINNYLKNSSYQTNKTLMIVASVDINAARKRCMGYDGFWLVNKEHRKLIVYENQPVDFLKLRNALEIYLETGKLDQAAVKEETKKQKVESNVVSMRAYNKKSRNYNDIRRFITVTNIIIAINLIVFFIVAIGGDVEDATYIHEKGGLAFNDIDVNKEYYRFITSMFLHFGAAHLMYNMLFIFCFGNTIEPELGKIKLIAIYIISGLGAGFAEYHFNLADHLNEVCAGASGASYGLMGALIALTLVDRAFRYHYDFRRVALIAIMFIAVDATRDNIANWAHAGGLVTGFISTFAIVSISNAIRKK